MNYGHKTNVFMKQQVKNIGTEVKEAKLISVYSNFGQKAPREHKFLSLLYPGSCPNMLLPSCLTSSPSSQNKQNNKYAWWILGEHIRTQYDS